MNYLFALPGRRFPLVALILSLLCSPLPGWSEEIDPSSRAADPSPVNPPTLDPVIVLGSQDEARDPSASKLTGETLEALPLRNRQVDEALKLLPHVQGSDSAELSTQGGEIFPSEVSISGGRTYRNYYQVDGFGANSYLDPVSDNHRNIDFLPGQSMNLFLNTGLIGSMTLYDSNISSEFGGFTGGVVDVKTKDPGEVLTGGAYYRTTRDTWTSFHVDKEEEEDFFSSTSERRQPRFHKEEAGFDVHLPVNNRLGLLLGYSILHSEIPLRHLGSTEDQTRQIENWFAKANLTPSDRTTLKFTFLATPAQRSYFMPDTKNSRVGIEQNNYRFGVEFEHLLPSALLKVDAALARSQTKRDSPQDNYFWSTTPSADWGELLGTKYSQEGGIGSLEVSQREVQLKTEMALDPFPTGPVQHFTRTGFDLQQIRASYDRKETLRFYLPLSTNENSLVSCGGADGCIDGEQAFTRRNIYEPSASDARVRMAHLWGEDRMQFGRLAIRPGVRLSWDDLMENFTAAPRLTGTLDLFGGGTTLFHGGLNRYYAAPLLFSALRTGLSPRTSQTRTLNDDGSLSEWTTSSVSRTSYPFRELDTPYSDEVTVALDQGMAGGRLLLKYVRRDGKDEYARERVLREEAGTKYTDYILNNTGRSRYEGYSMAWERHSDRVSLGFNVTYIDTNATSNPDYDSYFDEEKATERVWYKGEAVYEYDLPKGDYNRKWTGNLICAARLPLGVSFTNVTRYRSGYSRIDKTKEDPVLYEGEELNVYEEVDHPESWIFDWKLAWTTPSVHGNRLTLTAEVLNVFNRQILAGAADDEYEIGRQLWAGAEWRF